MQENKSGFFLNTVYSVSQNILSPEFF